MEQAKPVLIPSVVPWTISSVPYLKLHATGKGEPSFLTFIGYFKLNHKDQGADMSSPIVVNDPGEFRLDPSADGAPYRMVRVVFEKGVRFRKCSPVSDSEVIPESNYDWSEVPGSLRPGEDVRANLERTNQYWIKTGHSPDPSYYEVLHSPWISELGIDDSEFHHYIVAGDDEYFDIIAHGWRWEGGQQA
jgi:hypothetical protein